MDGSCHDRPHAEQRGQLVEGGELFQGLDDDCLGGTLWRGWLHHELHGAWTG